MTTTGSPWQRVDSWFDEVSPVPQVLQDAQRAADDAEMPPIAVSAAQGRLLRLLAGAVGATRVVEIGTLAGVSTIWLASALRGPDAHLTTFELDPAHAALARANIDRAGFGSVVDVRVGPALEGLAGLAAERPDPYDLAFVDADKPSNPAYLEAVLPLLRTGAIIVVDNVVRNGAVADTGVDDPKVVGSRTVIEAVAARPDLEATVLQTVGVKGYDGMLVARVTG